ncbi:SIR2 family protein [Pseudoalteromonas rubra]|uniref:Uncharacterized protein n=1 Tax=Pseudoalteromonas rubra TaxID=43658 RepID=A0A5S3X5K5_9GAMM|nr:SIR2 family protein [Pseudoalteromonas rubra]TMP39680.1 hypothetical protein CWB98_03580 [Pseudoalteromonas rubra]
MDKMQELANAFSGETILFIGSGASRRSGLPFWRELIEWLKEYCDRLGGDITTADALIKKDKLLDAASELTHQLEQNNKSLADFFEEYEKNSAFRDAEPSEIHQLLGKLPSQFFVTPNYDLLLEKKFGQNDGFTVVRRGDKEGIGELLHGELDGYVFKYHGCIESPQNIILTYEDYNNEIHNYTDELDCLKTLVKTKTIVFIGAGLDDPDFKFVRDNLINLSGAERLRIWAFMSDCSDEVKYYKRTHGINLISYKSENNHAELLVKLDELVKNIIEVDESKKAAANMVMQEINITTHQENVEINLREVLVAANEEIIPLDEQILGFVALMGVVKKSECTDFLVGFKGNSEADVGNRIDYLVNRGLVKQTPHYLMSVKKRYSTEAAVGIEDDVMAYIAEREDG